MVCFWVLLAAASVAVGQTGAARRASRAAHETAAGQCALRIKTQYQPAAKVADLGKQAELVFQSCTDNGWLSQLYYRNRKQYTKWAKREDLVLGMEEIWSKPALRQCLLSYARAQFWDDATNALQALTAWKGLAGTGGTPALRRKRACEIMIRFIVNPSNQNGAPDSEQANISFEQRQKILKALLPNAPKDTKFEKLDTTTTLCTAETGDVGPTTFDEAIEAVTALIRSNLAPFFVSEQWRACKGSSDVAKDMASFDMLQQQFCAAEKTAFTAGDALRKSQTLRQVHQDWMNKCKTDPDFDPDKLPILVGGQAGAQKRAPPPLGQGRSVPRPPPPKGGKGIKKDKGRLPPVKPPRVKPQK